MRDDAAVVQFDRDFPSVPFGWRSGMVRASARGGTESLSERRVVPVLQGPTRTDKGQLREERGLVHQVVEESGRLAALPSSLLLGADVVALHNTAVEQSGHVRLDAVGRVQLVAYHLPLPGGRDSADAKAVVLESGEGADRQPDDAGADLQTAHSRQVAADGEVRRQTNGTLLRAKEVSCSSHLRAYVLVEYV